MFFFLASTAFYSFLIVATLIATGQIRRGVTLTGARLLAFRMREHLKKGSPTRVGAILAVAVVPMLIMLFLAPAAAFCIWLVFYLVYFAVLGNFSSVCNKFQVGYIAPAAPAEQAPETPVAQPPELP